MLDSHGFGHVMIVATDNTGWAISADMKKDPELAAAISVIGYMASVKSVHRDI